jgi:hypothetical protein
MIQEPQKTYRHGFAHGWGSQADAAVHAGCRRGSETTRSWIIWDAGTSWFQHGHCKYLIFRRLSPFFTFFRHFSYHFSAISNWFLASCRKMGGYLNRGLLGNAKTLLKARFSKMANCNTNRARERTQSIEIAPAKTIAKHRQDAGLLPEFQANSAYFGLIKAKIDTGGYPELALLRWLQRGGSGARLFAASLYRYYHS